jgi:hypothetical protein
MATCDYCNKNYNFFGVEESGYGFCSANCRDRAKSLLTGLNRLSPQQIDGFIDRACAGPCRQCGQAAPVDLYQSYRVVSMLIITRWATHNHFVCRACARKEQAKSLAYSALLGWWGFPFGFILTPIQIIRNIVALAGASEAGRPSMRLQNLLKLDLARQLAAPAT